MYIWKYFLNYHILKYIYIYIYYFCCINFFLIFLIFLIFLLKIPINLSLITQNLSRKKKSRKEPSQQWETFKRINAKSSKESTRRRKFPKFEKACRKSLSHKRLFYKLTKLAFLYLIFPTSMAYPVRTQGSQPRIVSRKGFKISIISSPF